ncbi:MAG: PD40 domain-containing protein [Gammaproteobacteria bacterium]|nr:PD40 domain-containing protein [Gammaproteobacteria bacterium]
MNLTPILFLLLLFPFGEGGAAIFHGSDWEWQSRESHHFRIHYHQGEEAIAVQALTIAEKVHRRLSPYLEWEPEGKTEVVLSDEFDQSNGYSTPIPYNTMTLFLSPPDEINSLEDHNGWLEMLTLHEYLHILHLDKRAGFPALLQNILGRMELLFPNAFQPSWVHEGLATYIETDPLQGVGRGQSSFYEMMMRMEVLAGLKPVQQVNQPLRSWPMGATPYLYGVYFFQFIADRFGEEVIPKLVSSYSDNLIPFRINSNSRQVLGGGYDYPHLWQAFRAELEQRFQQQRDQIVARGESGGEWLTNDGYFQGDMALQRDDGTLYYIRANGEEEATLMRLGAGDERPEEIAPLPVSSRLSIHPQQGLLVARPEICRGSDLYYDLFTLNSAGEEQRLTHCSRYRRAIWSPSGEEIVAVALRLGESALYRLNPAATTHELLWQGEAGTTIAAIDWHPQLPRLVAAVWRRDRGWELEEFDLNRRSWSVLTTNDAIESTPRYSDDGKSVVFSADYDGVYNIYRYQLEEKRLEQWTNVVSGAFSPLWDESRQRLYYNGYRSEGFDLVRQPVSVVATPLLPSRSPPSPPLPQPEVEIALTQPQPYSPFSSLLPRWWFPMLYSDENRTEVGFTTSGRDVLNRHIYALTAAYDTTNRWGSGAVNYLYDRWYPLFKLTALHWKSGAFAGEGESQQQLYQRQHTLIGGELLFPRRTRRTTAALHLGIGSEQERQRWSLTPDFELDDRDDRYGGIGVSYSSAAAYPLGSGPSQGLQLLLAAEKSGDISSRDGRGEALLLQWQQFFHLGGAHRGELQLALGQDQDLDRQFTLGRDVNTPPFPTLIDSPLSTTLFNRREFRLRGYRTMSGSRLGLIKLGYHFPLRRVERGWMAPPLGLDQIHGGWFFESGATWSLDEASPQQLYSSSGLEIHFDTVLFYSMGLRLTAGFAIPLQEAGENEFYLRLGGPF